MGESAEIASLRAEIEALKTQVMSMRSDMDVSGGAVSSSGTGGSASGGYGTPWAIPDGYRLPGGAGGDGLYPYKVRVDGSGSSKRYLIYLPDPARVLMVNGTYCDLTSNTGSHSISAENNEPGWYVLSFSTGDVWLHARSPYHSTASSGGSSGPSAYIDNQAEGEAPNSEETQNHYLDDVYNVKIASIGSGDEVTQFVKSALSLSPGWTAVERYNANGIEILGDLGMVGNTGLTEPPSCTLTHAVSLLQDSTVVATNSCDVDLWPIIDYLMGYWRERMLWASDDSSDDLFPFEVEPKSGLVLLPPTQQEPKRVLDLAGRAALNSNGETFGIRKIVMHAGYTAKNNDSSVYVLGCNHFPANGLDVWPKGIRSVVGSGVIHVSPPDENGSVTVSFGSDPSGGQGSEGDPDPQQSDDNGNLFSGEQKVVIDAQYDTSTHKFSLKYATVTVESGLITGWDEDAGFDTANPVFTATQHAPEVS